jgi:ABC-2 type transport system permease protein
MVGKIVGVAAVGFTQFLIWIILSFGLYSIGLSTVGLNQERIAQIQQMTDEEQEQTEEFTDTQIAISNITKSTESLSIPLLVGCFVFYFLGGYLLYGSLFAAVGAGADSETDTQQFMLPVTIPLIFSIVMLGPVLANPNSTLAFWLSIIPLFSPVIMMMRIPFGVPGWEIALSMILLIIGFFAIAWLAGRIYRIGILMHGSKVNWKTLGKWVTMKV